jgi:hypothetical protein
VFLLKLLCDFKILPLIPIRFKLTVDFRTYTID